jgi:hypothetical protein
MGAQKTGFFASQKTAAFLGLQKVKFTVTAKKR